MKQDSQTKEVLIFLRNSRKGMTVDDAIKLGNPVYRLSARILDLRAQGHVIDTEMEKNRNNDGRHARYWLIKEAPQVGQDS